MSKITLLNKPCSCSGIMTIHMHTLIYSAKVKITGVPVYTCPNCSRYEPLPYIKRDLGKLISELQEAPGRRKYSFSDRNEWASVLQETFEGVIAREEANLEDALLLAVHERIDLLLDIYRFANDCSDEAWMNSTARRLSQLSQQTPEKAI